VSGKGSRGGENHLPISRKKKAPKKKGQIISAGKPEQRGAADLGDEIVGGEIEKKLHERAFAKKIEKGTASRQGGGG